MAASKNLTVRALSKLPANQLDPVRRYTLVGRPLLKIRFIPP